MTQILGEITIGSNQICEQLGVAQRTLSRMVKEGKFPQSYRFGKKNIWLQADLEAYLIYRFNLNGSVPNIKEERLVEIRNCAQKARN